MIAALNAPRSHLFAPITRGHVRYDAFLSYSHRADEAYAPVVRKALQQLGKAWYRRRALRVFLDTSNLASNPALWPTIAKHLESSQFFVLLCSPQSASSEWVEKELTYWLQNGPRRPLAPRAHRRRDRVGP